MNTVLIIEDDQTIADMYKDKFRMSNFTVSIARDGETGLILAEQNKPNLILLDLALPKLNGIDIMEKLRSDTWGKTVPIIILTNLNVDGKILEGITKYNPVYCLLKANTTPEEILQKANEILTEQRPGESNVL